MDRRLENAQGVADQIMAPGGKGIAVEADVTNKASLDAMVEQTL